MEYWFNFCPRKLYWELTFAKTKGKNPTGDWMREPEVLEESLKQLKVWNISGIRLIVYPSEITEDGIDFNWRPIDKVITYCEQVGLKIDFCLGPFQYPHYPGIFLPKKLLYHLTEGFKFLDNDPALKDYALYFLQKQLERYGNNKQINGFYLGNEWPDFQKIETRRELRVGVSESFMIEAAKLIKNGTNKNVILNTNIDAIEYGKMKKTFGKILAILKENAVIGLDIYPSQEKWKNVPKIKLLRNIFPYRKSTFRLSEKLKPAKLIFSEIEAQPWGSGKSWFTMINEDKELIDKTLTDLKETLNEKIIPSKIEKATLWSSEFWLVAKEMGLLKDQLRKSLD